MEVDGLFSQVHLDASVLQQVVWSLQIQVGAVVQGGLREGVAVADLLDHPFLVAAAEVEGRPPFLAGEVEEGDPHPFQGVEGEEEGHSPFLAEEGDPHPFQEAEGEEEGHPPFQAVEVVQEC